MARKRFRITGFAKFMLFLLIVTPIAYLGVSYYKGEDPIKNIKEWVRTRQVLPDEEEGVTPPTDGSLTNKELYSLIQENEAKIDSLSKRIRTLEKEQDILERIKEIAE